MNHAIRCATLLNRARLESKVCRSCGLDFRTDYCYTCMTSYETGHTYECHLGKWMNNGVSHAGHFTCLVPSVIVQGPKYGFVV